MSDLASITTRRAPFCPSCGDLAQAHSEYREQSATPPIVSNNLVRLAWVCVCGMECSVEAKVRQQDAVA